MEYPVSNILMFQTFRARLLGQVPSSDANGGLNLDDWIDPRDQRKQDRFIQLGLVAACQAVEDSGWQPNAREQQNRTGVMIGSGIGGLESIVNTDQLMNEKGPRRVSPFFIPSALISDLISGHVSIRYGFMTKSCCCDRVLNWCSCHRLKMLIGGLTTASNKPHWCDGRA